MKERFKRLQIKGFVVGLLAVVMLLVTGGFEAEASNSRVVDATRVMPLEVGTDYRIRRSTVLEFTVPHTGLWNFFTHSIETGDPILGITNQLGWQVAWDDDGGEDFNSFISVFLNEGETYFIFAGFFSANSGDYILSVERVPLMRLNPTGGRQNVNNHTFFEFTPNTSGIWEFRTSDNTGNPYLALLSDSGSIIIQDDDSGDGLNSLIRHHLVAGETYFIDAGFFSGTSGNYILSVNQVAPTRLDSAGGRQNVNSRTFFEFTPNTSGVWEFRTFDNIGDPYLVLMSGSGSIITQNDDGGDGLNSLIRHQLVAGQTYFIDARFFGNTTGSYTLTVSRVSD